MWFLSGDWSQIKNSKAQTLLFPSPVSVAQSCPTLGDPKDCSTPGFPVHHQLPELAQTHVRQVGGAIQPSNLLSSPSPDFNISQHQGLFQWVALCIRWPKYWSFSISPSNEHPGLTSFRMDWLDLLAVQGTFKSLLQHHSWKASILWCSAFFMVQLSHLYMTIGKTIDLTIWTFVSKVMSLLFTMLSRFVLAFQHFCMYDHIWSSEQSWEEITRGNHPPLLSGKINKTQPHPSYFQDSTLPFFLPKTFWPLFCWKRSEINIEWVVFDLFLQNIELIKIFQYFETFSIKGILKKDS